MTWLLTANVSDETSGVARVEFFIDGESVGNVTTPPYKWEYSGGGQIAQATVYDNAGNEATSKRVKSDSHSQSQSQSSSSPVQRRISWICLGGLTGIQNTQRRV